MEPPKDEVVERLDILLKLRFSILALCASILFVIAACFEVSMQITPFVTIPSKFIFPVCIGLVTISSLGLTINRIKTSVQEQKSGKLIFPGLVTKVKIFHVD